MKLYIVLFVAAMAAAEDVIDVEQILVDGNNQFTAKMFSEVTKINPDRSVVISAFSVLSPLAQLALASVGESHDEIYRAIGMPNDNVTKSVFPHVNSKLRSVKGVELKTANKIYIADNFELNDEFASLSRDVFNSELKNIDFTKNVETANEINTWVEDNTNHRIKDLVNPDSLDSNTRAVLVNAIYFKGSWKEKFNPSLTTDRDFHVSKDKTVKIPTMYRKGDFKYGESSELNAKMLEISYEGDESSMLIILPNEIDGITDLQEKLKDPSAVQRATKDMFTVEVAVYLPKFKIETETNLKQVLSEMGIEKLFDSSKARLDNLLKKTKDLYISDAVQKAFIEVNEEGAEAAAANAVFETKPIPAPRFRKLFGANHPFMFYLNRREITLFNGVFNS